MKATGRLLKERREALKISLAEVSISTKITSRMLAAIEAGNLELLPARTFLRGFVKSYAAYLKMDTEQVLKVFNEDMAALEPPPPAPTTEPAPATAPRVESPGPKSNVRDFIPEGISNFKKAGLGLGLVVLLGLISVVYQLVQKYEREGQVATPPPTLSKIEQPKEEAPEANPPKVEPEDAPSEAQAVEAVNPEVEPKAAEVKPAETKPVAPAPKEESPKAPPVETQKPVAEVKPPPSPTPAPVAVPKPAPAAAPPAAPTAETKPVAESKPAAAPGTTQEIIIEALDKVDITFKVNNGQPRKVSLAPDQVHTIKASGIVAIEISDGGAINIIHNGRDVGVPGDLGRPKKIQLP